MEHNKTKLFHFTRACHPPNPSINLSSVGGSVISPKPIWQYLGFYFDRKLNFNYHTHFYAMKCLSTLSAMKMLDNSSRGLLPIQKQLLYRTCVLPITLYGFQLWFFKGTPIVKNITELKKRLSSGLQVLSVPLQLKALKLLQASSPLPYTSAN